MQKSEKKELRIKRQMEVLYDVKSKHFLSLLPGYGSMDPSRAQGCNKNSDGQDKDGLSKLHGPEVVPLLFLCQQRMTG